MTTTTLYRLFDADDRLLYVGISDRAMQRWGRHRQGKPWWSEVDHVTVEHFTDRQAALDAEIAAIRTERPLHNIAGAVASTDQAPEEPPADLDRSRDIGTRTLAIRWPVAERLADQRWLTVRSPQGTWGVALVVDGWYTDKRGAEESLPVWADTFEDAAFVLPEKWEPPTS